MLVTGTCKILKDGQVMITHLECCGLREITGLSEFNTARGALLEIVDTVLGCDGEYPKDWSFGAMIFTEAGSGRYGTRFAKFLVGKGLGTVTAVPQFHNPNSGRNVRTFVWTVDRQAVSRWHKAEDRDREG